MSVNRQCRAVIIWTWFPQSLLHTPTFKDFASFVFISRKGWVFVRHYDSVSIKKKDFVEMWTYFLYILLGCKCIQIYRSNLVFSAIEDTRDLFHGEHSPVTSKGKRKIQGENAWMVIVQTYLKGSCFPHFGFVSCLCACLFMLFSSKKTVQIACHLYTRSKAVSVCLQMCVTPPIIRIQWSAHPLLRTCGIYLDGSVSHSSGKFNSTLFKICIMWERCFFLFLFFF